jgi:hypothetical protein
MRASRASSNAASSSNASSSPYCTLAGGSCRDESVCLGLASARRTRVTFTDQPWTRATRRRVITVKHIRVKVDLIWPCDRACRGINRYLREVGRDPQLVEETPTQCILKSNPRTRPSVKVRRSRRSPRCSTRATRASEVISTVYRSPSIGRRGPMRSTVWSVWWSVLLSSEKLCLLRSELFVCEQAGLSQLAQLLQLIGHR